MVRGPGAATTESLKSLSQHVGYSDNHETVAFVLEMQATETFLAASNVISTPDRRVLANVKSDMPLE